MHLKKIHNLQNDTTNLFSIITMVSHMSHNQPRKFKNHLTGMGCLTRYFHRILFFYRLLFVSVQIECYFCIAVAFLCHQNLPWWLDYFKTHRLLSFCNLFLFGIWTNVVGACQSWKSIFFNFRHKQELFL